MPRTALTVNTCDHLTGLSDPSYVSFDQANGHEVTNTASDVVLIIKNTNASGRTVTVVSSQIVDTNLAVSDRTFSLSALTGELHIAKFPASVYNHTDNLLYLDIDDGTDVTILAVRYIT